MAASRPIFRTIHSRLIHCDFNEFNLLVDDDENVTLIDFPQVRSITNIGMQLLAIWEGCHIRKVRTTSPQMISTSHPNARSYDLGD